MMLWTPDWLSDDCEVDDWIPCEMCVVNNIDDVKAIWWADPDDCGIVKGKIIWVRLDGEYCCNPVVT